jgi:Protein of unknown function (DUF3761)
MRQVFLSCALATGLIMSASAYAQAPAGSTGVCKDGSYASTPTKKGACARHGGVKEWFGDAASEAPAKTATPATGAAPSAAKPAPAAQVKTTTMPAAPGGGTGQVWVNTSTKVYHCQGTKWYGKTKAGEYMTEAAAKAAGSHADHGKACAS